MPAPRKTRSAVKSSTRVAKSGKQVPHTSARHRVRDGIERMILEGRIRPGEKLVQLHLSKRYGVSLGMIREALFELIRSGLIETVDNKGMFVRQFDAAAAREFFAVRELFEGLAARECCGKVSEEQACELTSLAQGVYGLAVAKLQLEKIDLDRKFHMRIVEISGNRLLIDMSRQYGVLGKIIGVDSNPQDTLAGHLEIIKAIQSGDQAMAEHAARMHVKAALDTIEQRHASGEPIVYAQVIDQVDENI